MSKDRQPHVSEIMHFITTLVLHVKYGVMSKHDMYTKIQFDI